jgi:hypothetical protein
VGNNIWYYLLALALASLETFIFGSLPNATNAINFATPMVQGFVIFCELAYTFFSVFNLLLFGAYLGFLLVVSLLKIIMGVVNFIKELLPLISRLFV